MKEQKQKAFTLVELIVVITILAILGTIAFISLQGYSQNSRDSVRISDISTMKSALELFNLDAGKYPNPTAGVDITLSGSIVWNQGTFGETVEANVDKLDKIPFDPLTDTHYTYSVTGNRNKFQLGGILEGDPLAFNYFENASAELTEGTALITGTYNGQAAKAMSGSNCSMVTVPSIITNDVTNTDLQQIINSGSLVYNGYKNLPASFKTSKFKHDGGFAFTPNQLVAYSDTNSCTDLTDGSNYVPRVTLLKGIQTSYSGTLLASESDIARIISLNINILTPSEEVKNLAGTYVNNNFGGSVKIIPVTPTTTYSNCIATTSSGYTIPQLNHNQSSNVTKTGSISNGTQNYGAQANCSNGTINLVDEAINIVCTSGYVEQTGTCVADVCGSTVPSNAHSTATSQTVSQTWTQNTTPGVCTFVCDTHYTWNGTSCTADTQNTSCTGKPINAIWNTASSITQTWNGTIWTPSESPTYNTSGSTTACRYTCDSGYHTEDAGVSCVSNTRSCVISNATATETWNGSGWGTCTVTSCNSGYYINSNTCNSQWTGNSTTGYLFKNISGIQQYPVSCNDLLLQSTWKNNYIGSPWNGSIFSDGVYWIKPNSDPAFKVFCDMTTNGGGWTNINYNFGTIQGIIPGGSAPTFNNDSSQIANFNYYDIYNNFSCSIPVISYSFNTTLKDIISFSEVKVNSVGYRLSGQVACGGVAYGIIGNSNITKLSSFSDTHLSTCNIDPGFNVTYSGVLQYKFNYSVSGDTFFRAAALCGTNYGYYGYGRYQLISVMIR